MLPFYYSLYSCFDEDHTVAIQMPDEWTGKLWALTWAMHGKHLLFLTNIHSPGLWEQGAYTPLGTRPSSSLSPWGSSCTNPSPWLA